MKDLAIKFGFVPFNELSKEQKDSVLNYCNRIEAYKNINPSFYWWKESSVGDNNWISFNVKNKL